MKKELLSVLACPLCKQELILTIEEEEGEIITGSLYCKKCDVVYPITNAIPNLIPSASE